MFEQGYDESYLEATNDADCYRSKAADGSDRHLSCGGIALPKLDHSSSLSIKVLPELYGKPWNNAALNMIHGLRPSSLRVTTGEVYLDARPWRVTVMLEQDERTIRDITQEVTVGVQGVRFGHDLTTFFAGCRPVPVIDGMVLMANLKGLEKLELFSSEPAPEEGKVPK